MIYAEYINIPADYYQDKIRFFENNRHQLDILPHDVFLMIKIDYLKSLYRVREYNQFLYQVDGAIESLIIDNPDIPGARNIFEDLISKKAIALHLDMQYERASEVCTELVRLQPTGFNKRLFLKNHRDRLRRDDQTMRGLIIGLIFLSGIILAVELLVIRTLLTEFTATIETMRNVTFIIAISLFLVQEARFFFSGMRELNRILKK